MKSTMKEHMAAFHKAAEKHHMAMAEAETAKAAGHRALGETLDDGAACEKCAEGCDKAAASHATMATYHEKCCKTMEAAMKADEDNLDKVIPTNARVTIPSDVPVAKAIPRIGQPLVDTTNVPAEFHEFLKIEA